MMNHATRYVNLGYEIPYRAPAEGGSPELAARVGGLVAAEFMANGPDGSAGVSKSSTSKPD